MKNAAKIRLSRVEAQLVKRSDWILTKNDVMLKIKKMLEDLQEEQRIFAQQYATSSLQRSLNIPPKVSRGENYQGLPWLVLDYPRSFNKENILAIRTMFWWGKHFSVTLLAAGESKLLLEPALIKSYSLLRKHDYAYCIHPDPWQHHFERDNYTSLAGLTKAGYEKMVRDNSFFKAGRKFPVGNFEELPGILNQEYRRLIRIVAH